MSSASAAGGVRRQGGRTAALAAWLLFILALRAAAGGEEPPRREPAELGEAAIVSAGPIEYRPGRGLRLGRTGLVIGGFTNVKAEHSEESGGEFALDNLNFFLIYDRFTRFRAVAELELKDIFIANEEGVGAQDFAFAVRRLFGDYSIADELRVRAGTFLTPVGYWNLILAPPLTWTTEAPLIVEQTFFEPTTTGVMVHGSTALGGGQLGYSLFSQLLEPLENDPDLHPPEHTAGLRLAYEPSPGLSAGASYQGAEDEEGRWSQLGGLFLLWEHRRGQVLGEFLYQDGEALSSSQWGLYVQGVLEVYEPFYLVGRYEHYAPPAPLPALELFTLGAVYKPFPFMALKVEYRFVDHAPPEDNPAGFFASFTSFF